VRTTIVLENERPMSLNTFYAGRHWSVRSEEANRVHQLVASELVGCEAIDVPVHIVIETGWKDKRRHDPDGAACKLYIDGLVHGGLLVDDDMEHVLSVTLRSVRSDRYYVKIVVVPEAAAGAE
jgi:Holliday junction resolvase RusA-like endonuclease